MALKYDADSGQVFTETVCSVAPTRPDWTQRRMVIGRSNISYETPFLNWTLQEKNRRRREFDAKQRSAKGASELLKICEKACTDNLDRLSLPVLHELPMYLGRRIHDIAVDRDLLSLNFWKAFIRAYYPIPANDDDEIQNISLNKARSVFLAHLSEEDFALPLKTHVAYTVSQNCEWLSAISIHGCKPTLADFMSLADLPNLVLLQLKDVYGFDSKITRAWSQRVLESGGSAFAKLRVLSVYDVFCLTESTLAHFQLLPALDALNVNNSCFGEPRRLKYGNWELIPVPRPIAPDYQDVHGNYLKKLLRRFLDLNLEERPLLYLHYGCCWTSRLGLSYFQILDRSALKLLLRDYSKKGLLEVEWVKVEWWFRSNSKQDIVKSHETPEEARTASRKSTVVAPTKMKKINHILGDMM